MSGQIDTFKSKKKKDKQNKDPKSHIQEHKEPKFKVYINAGEMERIHEWVMKHPDIETGGDLFGLWIDKCEAVVQFVLGPGKHCRRTITSFFQDVYYLADAGNYLTEQHGLCNIGQWHSHHTIPLCEPSAGDHNTVWSNLYIMGMKRYIVLIANIKDGKPSVNCFLFEIQNGKQLPVEKGCFKALDGNSPFRLNSFVMENVRNGAESLNDKDKVCKPADEISGQDDSEIRQTPKADIRNAENGLSVTPNIDDKHVSAGRKEIDDSGKENEKNTEFDDHDHQDNTNTTKTETEHRLQKSNTRTKLLGTQRPDGKFVFNTSSNEEEKSRTLPSEKHHELKVEEEEITGQSKSTNHQNNLQHDTTNGKEPTSPSEKHQEIKVPDPLAESVHEAGNNKETGNAITGQPKSPDHHSNPQQTNTTNGEEKAQTSQSEEHQESKVNDPPAASVHKGRNHPETEKVSTGQSRSSNDRSHPQQTTTTNEEEKEPTSPSQDPQELNVNDQAAESVDEGKNDPGSEEAITDQPKPPDDHSDPQPTTTTDREEKSQTSGNDPPAEVRGGGFCRIFCC